MCINWINLHIYTPLCCHGYKLAIACSMHIAHISQLGIRILRRSLYRAATSLKQPASQFPTGTNVQARSHPSEQGVSTCGVRMFVAVRSNSR